MKISLLIIFVGFIYSTYAHAQMILPTSGELERAIDENQLQAKKLKADQLFSRYSSLQLSSVARPWAEYEKAKYLFFADNNVFGSEVIKEKILHNLPAGVIPVIYTASSYTNLVRNIWQSYMPPAMPFIVLEASSLGDNFWSRDALPVPVIGIDKKLKLVDAKYFKLYEADLSFAEFAHADLLKHDYYFEGGNFATDRGGNCFLIDYRTGKSIPDEILYQYYGCKTINRLPFIEGIGHIDERIKIVSDHVALTDTKAYIPYLQARGFEVELLPVPKIANGTYLNSLQVNGVIYLPVFEERSDYEAIVAYERLGFRVIPIDARNLVRGFGSIHCISMTYPEL